MEQLAIKRDVEKLTDLDIEMCNGLTKRDII